MSLSWISICIIILLLVSFFIFLSSRNKKIIVSKKQTNLNILPGNNNVKLISTGANKIALLKTFTEVTDLGLKEAKDIIDSAPSYIYKNIDENSAALIKEKMELEGATINIETNQ